MTLDKPSGSLLGGDTVVVSGLSLLDDDKISCVFGKTELDGLYLSENQALCVTPSYEKEGYVEFKLSVQRGNDIITGGAPYQYSK